MMFQNILNALLVEFLSTYVTCLLASCLPPIVMAAKTDRLRCYQHKQSWLENSACKQTETGYYDLDASERIDWKGCSQILLI